jgi:4,5-dihydroxyphthalate decarboxylase
MADTSTKRRLRALLGNYPHTAGIKSRTFASDRFDFDFTEVEPVWDGFDAMVRHQAYDVSEMAAVTYMLAIAWGKPMALLPAAMVGRFQHPFAIYNADRGALTPEDLNGQRIGVRSVSTTTGLWLRGILVNDHGVDPDSIRWVTSEEPHVEECEDPSERMPEGTTLVQMLLDGKLDAVLGERSDDPRVRNLFGDPKAAAERWHAKRQIVPVNHFVVVSRELVETDPDLVREVYRVLKAGKDSVPPASPDTIPFGIEANRPALEVLSDYVFQLRLVPRRISVDEMFDPVCKLVS